MAKRKKWAKWTEQELPFTDIDYHLFGGKVLPVLDTTAESQARKITGKGDTIGAVLAPISYENSPADVPPSPAGNEAFCNSYRIIKQFGTMHDLEQHVKYCVKCYGREQ